MNLVSGNDTYTITFLKTGSVEYILSILNSFHPNIEFTCATENNPKLALLDVLLFRERVL